MISKPYLIAEIGINHNGNIFAKKLIKISKEAGFDAVKFQRDINLVYEKVSWTLLESP